MEALSDISVHSSVHSDVSMSSDGVISTMEMLCSLVEVQAKVNARL